MTWVPCHVWFLSHGSEWVSLKPGAVFCCQTQTQQRREKKRPFRSTLRDIHLGRRLFQPSPTGLTGCGPPLAAAPSQGWLPWVELSPRGEIGAGPHVFPVLALTNPWLIVEEMLFLLHYTPARCMVVFTTAAQSPGHPSPALFRR